MNDNTIKCFIHAARSLSFSQAAASLYMTRQSVSRQILKLEQELGAQLFSRSGSSLELTRSGELVLEAFEDVDRRMEELKTNLRQLSEQGSDGVVRLYCLNGIDLSRLLTPVIRALGAQGCRVMMERYEMFQIEAVAADKSSDIILAHQGIEDKAEGWQWTPICDQPMVLAVGLDHPLARTAVTAAEFAGQTIASYERTGDTRQATIIKTLDFCRVHGFYTKNVRIYPNIDTAHAAVECGEGISLCTENNILLKSPMVKAYPMETSTRLICLHRPAPKPQAAELVRLLVEQGAGAVSQ